MRKIAVFLIFPHILSLYSLYIYSNFFEMRIYFIYVTFGSLKEARSVGSKLVKNKLAACTNIIPTIYSTFIWKKKARVEKECSMIVKTSKSKVKLAIKFILKTHSYSCPAVTAFPIEHSHPEFKKWIKEQTES